MATKHYFPVPNSISHKIELGDIITDPYNPDTVLTTASEGNLPPVPTNIEHAKLEYKHPQISEAAAPLAPLELSSTFVGSGVAMEGGLSSERTHAAASEYCFKGLRTIFYNPLRLEDVLVRVVCDERVWTKMRAKSLFWQSKPVYIVTGLKTARESRVRISMSGSETGTSKTPVMSEEWSPSTEAVIAYRISKIEMRSDVCQGVKMEDLKMEDFTTGAAF